MIRPVRCIALLTFAVWMGVVPLGAHVFPKRAKRFTASLVQTYAVCTAPDTVTGGSIPACGGEPDPIDTVCGFGGGNADGTLAMQAGKQGIRVKAKLRGLAPTCDGEILGVSLGVRTTLDDCPDGHCVAIDQTLKTGRCTVSNGRCAISSTIRPGYPAGADSEMTVITCGISHGDVASFSCGMMIP